MVNIGLTKVDDAVAAKHPGLQRYAACQSHAFMKGTGTFVIAAAGLFAAQKAFLRKLPYAFQWNLLISLVLSSVASYSVTQGETLRCSDLWLLIETGEVPDRSPPKASKPDEPAQSNKTKYGDVMD